MESSIRIAGGAAAAAAVSSSGQEDASKAPSGLTEALTLRPPKGAASKKKHKKLIVKPVRCPTHARPLVLHWSAIIGVEKLTLVASWARTIGNLGPHVGSGPNAW
jgi:hypothetical protein